jgi:ribosomal protein S18 acetylase RimI-like enzyme
VSISIREGIPTPEEYNRLRESVGWPTCNSDAATDSLPKSLYCVCKFRDEKIIEMARVVGDGGLVLYIQDVIVISSFQGQGIDRMLTDSVMGYICSQASHNATIGLMAAKDKESLYRKWEDQDLE